MALCRDYLTSVSTKKWIGSMWLVKKDRILRGGMEPIETRKLLWAQEQDPVCLKTVQIYSGAKILVSGVPVRSCDREETHSRIHTFVPICMPIFAFVNECYFTEDSL